jgi:hypothetical protein
MIGAGVMAASLTAAGAATVSAEHLASARVDGFPVDASTAYGMDLLGGRDRDDSGLRRHLRGLVGVHAAGRYARPASAGWLNATVPPGDGLLGAGRVVVISRRRP